MIAFQRREQAFQMNTLPELVTYTAEDNFWHNLEYDIRTNLGLRELVHPRWFVERINPVPELSVSALLERPELLFQYYVYGNTVVQTFLLGFQDDSPERGIFYLNEALGRTLSEVDEQLLTTYWETLQEYLKDAEDPADAWEKCFLERLEPRKIAFRSQFQEERSIEQELARFTDTTERTAFTVKSLMRTFELTPAAQTRVRDLPQWFDRAVLSSVIPLIVIHGFHKVLKGHPYTLHPLPRDTNAVKSMFLWCTFGRVDIQHHVSRNAFTLSYTLKSGRVSAEEEQEYLEIISATLRVSPQDWIPLATQLNGTVTVNIRGIAFSVDLWRDLLLNDRRVQPWFAIDEVQMSSTDQQQESNEEDSGESGIRIPHVYIPNEYMFYAQFRTEEILLYLNRLDSSEQGDFIARRLSQIIGLYAAQRSSLERQYLDTYVSQLRMTTAQVVEQEPKLRTFFGPNYSRYAGNKVPRLLSAAEVPEMERRGFQVMSFPKACDREANEAPLYFVCDQLGEFRYPGLKPNPNYPQSSKYPYIVACYKNNHLEKMTKKTELTYRYYRSEACFADLDPRRKEDKTFVGLDKFKPCPNELNDLYKLNSAVAPVRRGVHRSPQSALECVLYALDIDRFRSLSVTARLEKVQQEFIRLTQNVPYAWELCAQEAWDQTEFPTLDQYFDLRYWIRLVERVYQCSIVLFGPQDFIFPRHVQGRWVWTYPSDRPVVVLYEHLGTARISYPQCEWVTFTDTTVDAAAQHQFVAQYAQTASGSITVSATELFGALESANYTLTAQHLDDYGKVYAWNVSRGRSQYTFLFRHIRVPPMDIPRTQPLFFGRPDDLSSDYFQLGPYACRVYATPFPESLLQTYETLREQVRLLTEQAKKIYADRLFNGAPVDDWSFIQIDPQRGYQPRDRYFFDPTATVVYVPNPDTRERLILVLSMFQRRFDTQLMAYVGATTVPFQYRTLSDFQRQPRTIVMGNQRTIRWNELDYPARLLSDDIPTDPFFTRLDNRLYRCVPIAADALPPPPYQVYVPQTHEIISVGRSPVTVLPVFLGRKTTTGDIHLYRCTPLQV